MRKKTEEFAEKKIRTKEMAEKANDNSIDDLPESEKLVFLPFSLAQEWYGVEVACLKEVIKSLPLTIVPDTPDFLVGVINLRGEIIPVFDLLSYFGLGNSLETFTRIMIVNCKKNHYGILIDNSREVSRVPKSTLQPPLNITDGSKRECICGIFYLRNKMITLLKVQGIFLSPRMNSANW